jgi:ferredoxin
LRREVASCGWKPSIIGLHAVEAAAGADLVGIGHPVHAWGAPRIIFDFLRRLPPGGGRPAFLFRTAGDPLLNGGATARVRRALARRGYDLLRDDLFIMPANVAIAYDPRLIKQLDLAAQRLAPRLAEEVLAGERHLPREGWGRQIASALFSRGESAGARCGPRPLRHCRLPGCGRCARECPAGNIALREGRPVFGWDCLMCLGCLYGCPAGALRPVVGRRFLLDGYDIAPAVADADLPADFLSPASPGMYRRFYAHLRATGALPGEPAEEGPREL